MDRCALFVDAGYALADGAMAVHGTRRRDSVSWDHAGLLKLLAGLARDRTGLPVLRCYWYETAAEGRRTAEHDALAEMPGLKLRLVNALPGRREGIESQLRRDLVTLAKSGAISDAFIASANEHIAEIVAEVQDLGLRVVILHIASDSGWTIPLPLRQECDDIVEISSVHLRSYVDLIKGVESVGTDESYRSGAVTHHGLPAAALPAAAAIYQVQDASDHRQGSLAYGSTGGHALAEPRITPGMAESRMSSDYQGEHAAGGSAQQSGMPKVAVNGTQSAGSAPPAGSPYSAAPSYQGSIGRQADAGSGYQSTGGYQADAGIGYQDGVASYQNGSAASYQGAGGPNGPGQGAGLDRGSQAGPAHNGTEQAGAGQGSDGPGRIGLNGVAPGGDPQGGGAGQVGVPPNGVAQSGAGRPAVPQNAYPADPGLGSLTSAGYQQQNSYQRAPGQSGVDQNGSGQNGMVGQSGVGYQGQNGAAQFGYPVGQQGAVPAGAQSSYQPGGPGQQGPSQQGPSQQGPSQQGPSQQGPSQSLPGHQSLPGLSGLPGQQGLPGQSGLPGQQGMPAQSGLPGQQGMPGQGASGGPGQPQHSQQGHPGQPAPQIQSQNGQPPGGYQLGHGGGQNGVRGGAMPGGFQPGGAPLDPRARDPYGSGQPQGSGGPEMQPLGAGQFSFGAPEASFVPGQVQGQVVGQPGTAAQDQSQRSGFGQGPGPQQGQDGGMVVQQQYQMSQQAAPLPAVRVQPVAIALPEAVKAAHAEGFSFGESVGRDAPGLWLEAVLARKPRMPSDLEARLLQGSVLPIDSLLHDEVRHSLRRGFWDALESARR
ncbi:MAG TPA: hypothetical protein VEV63_15000 [Streptosporangiaceae bacterium]|nr:hypothetical protein [Streptosporangiaceae bacterium]